MMLAGIIIGIAIGLAYRLVVNRCRKACAVRVVAPPRHRKQRAQSAMVTVPPHFGQVKGRGKGKGRHPGNGGTGSSSSTAIPLPPPSTWQRERQRDFERMVAAGVLGAVGAPAEASSTELVLVASESSVLTFSWDMAFVTLTVMIVSTLVLFCMMYWNSAPTKITTETQTEDAESSTWLSVVAITGSGQCFHTPNCDIITNPKRNTGKIIYKRACAYCVHLSFRG
jgi:hypothetical protein